ncbi:hypothetical protein TNCV_643701 [Trichonephila clavipes]|nr:hypothetical protein TNCV_643701 [Trichonephila clavipes]
MWHAAKSNAVFARRRIELKMKQKLLDIGAELEREKGEREEVYFQRTIDKYSACVEVGKPIDENSACVEVGTTHKHLRRGVNSNNFKNYFSPNDITCEEVKSVESTFLLDTSYVRATREPEKKKETATHIGIREAEDWFRPIDLAKDRYDVRKIGLHEGPNTTSTAADHMKIFSSGLHGSTAADSVRSEWPLWHAAKSNAVFARRRIELK